VGANESEEEGRWTFVRIMSSIGVADAVVVDERRTRVDASSVGVCEAMLSSGRLASATTDLRSICVGGSGCIVLSRHRLKIKCTLHCRSSDTGESWRAGHRGSFYCRGGHIPMHSSFGIQI
jgi:hypothetical protein